MELGTTFESIHFGGTKGLSFSIAAAGATTVVDGLLKWNLIPQVSGPPSSGSFLLCSLDGRPIAGQELMGNGPEPRPAPGTVGVREDQEGDNGAGLLG